MADTVIRHNDRFSAMDRRFEAIERRLDRDFQEVRAEIGSLRRTIVECHSSVVGHGILISELEARVPRIEDHLNRPSAA